MWVFLTTMVLSGSEYVAAEVHPGRTDWALASPTSKNPRAWHLSARPSQSTGSGRSTGNPPPGAPAFPSREQQPWSLLPMGTKSRGANG